MYHVRCAIRGGPSTARTRPSKYASPPEAIPLGRCCAYARDEAAPYISGLCVGAASVTSDLGCCILVPPRIDSPPFPGPQSPHSMPAGCPGDLPPHPLRAHLPHPMPTSPLSTLSFVGPPGSHFHIIANAVPVCRSCSKACDEGNERPWGRATPPPKTVREQWPLPCCAQTSPHSIYTDAPRGTVLE